MATRGALGPLNPIVRRAARPYVTTFEGFDQPWSHLAALVPELRVEKMVLGAIYVVSGVTGPTGAQGDAVGGLPPTGCRKRVPPTIILCAKSADKNVMVDAPSLTLAFAAGLVSFVSPCCLPLVPGYLATVSGAKPADLGRRIDPSVIARSAVFVASFSAIFVLLGLGATALGAWLFDNQSLLNTIAGVAIIAMGLLFVGSLFVTRLNRAWRPGGLIERAGRGGPVVAGAAFAIAWTPCVGPTLGAILGLASTSQGTGTGALLLVMYSAGLALPFLFSAVAFNAATRAFGFFKRHYAAVQATAGVVLVAMGVLVLTGELFRLNVQAQQLLGDFGLNFFKSI
jgi:cytochrome c-type biogenesis protein